MSHDRTIELLPWLLNGTLADDERREVEEHLAGCAECRSELAATRQGFAVYAAHLPPQVLTVYVESADGDALSVDGETVDRARIEEHLALCAACREDLEQVREAWTAVHGADGAKDTVPAPAVAALDVAPNVAAFRPATPPATAAQTPATSDWGWRSLALAASLLLAVLAVGWFLTNRELAGSERALAELRQEMASRGAAPVTGTPTTGTPATGTPATPTPSTGAPGTGSPASSPSAAELAAAQQRIAELEATLDQSNEQIADLGRRVDDMADAASRARPAPYLVPAQISGGEVVRGGSAQATAEAPTAPSAPALYLAPSVPAGKLADLSEVAYRFLGPDGEEVESGRLPVYQDPEVGPLVTLTWPVAGRAAGRYTLVLAAPDGAEIGRWAFRLPG